MRISLFLVSTVLQADASAYPYPSIYQHGIGYRLVLESWSSEAHLLVFIVSIESTKGFRPPLRLRDESSSRSLLSWAVVSQSVLLPR